MHKASTRALSDGEAFYAIRYVDHGKSPSLYCRERRFLVSEPPGGTAQGRRRIAR